MTITALVRIFAEIKVPAVVACLADDLAEHKGKTGIFPGSFFTELSHTNELQEVSPQFCGLFGDVDIQREDLTNGLDELQSRTSWFQVAAWYNWENFFAIQKVGRQFVLYFLSNAEKLLGQLTSD